MAIRALSFDLFDTLVDLGPVSSDAIQASTRALHGAVRDHADVDYEAFVDELQAVDRELRAPRYQQGLELATEQYFARLSDRLGIDDRDLPTRLTGLHMAAIRRHVRVPEHHLALLRSLRGRVRLGLCSNFTHAATARSILEEARLGDEFDAIVISVEVGMRKPRPEIFDALLAELAAEPDEVLHVGDSLRADVAGASARGVRSAWITRQIADPEAQLAGHDGPAPEFIVSDLREIENLLDAPSRR